MNSSRQIKFTEGQGKARGATRFQPVRSPQRAGLVAAAWIASGLLLLSILGPCKAFAQTVEATDEPVNMTVVVKEYDTGDPISQAHITLQFEQARTQRRPKKITYSSKTDMQGRCRLAEINKGPIVLVVTSPGHQTYGKDLTLEKDGQVFEVRLKKPQPLQ